MIATWTAYAIFLFVGYNSMVPGPLSISIAKTLGVDLSQISYGTAALYFGRVLAVQLAPKLLLPRPYKKVFLCLWICLVSALLLSAFSPTFPVFFFGWLCVGMLVGAMTFYANYFIVATYEKNERTSKLNMMNFFFSIGAISGPFIVGTFLELGFPWQVPYLVGTILLLPSLIGLKVNPKVLAPREDAPAEDSFEWTPALIWLVLGLLAYMIAETGFFFWMVPYLREFLGLPQDQAAYAVSIFWIFMGIGRFFAGKITKSFSVEYFIYILFTLAIIGYSATIFFNWKEVIYFWVALTGLGCSGLYATILSQGTSLVDYPSPKLVSTLVNLGTLGTVSGLVFYGILKNYLAIPTILMVGLSIMVFSLFSIFMMYRVNRKTS